MEERELIQKGIAELKAELDQLKQQPGFGTEPCDQKSFILLLAAIAGCRKMPGVKEGTSFTNLPICETEEGKAEAKNHLANLYGVRDANSLHQAVYGMYRGSDEYQQFMTFWNDTPLFDVKELAPEGRKIFEACKGYAELFWPVVGTHGFYGWDCNERIGLLAKGCACGIISEDEFWEQAVPLARRASDTFADWTEYALSCLCGAVYFMFCQSRFEEGDLMQFFEINLRLIHNFFFEYPLWAKCQWVDFGGKKFRLSPDKILPLLNDWQGPTGCLATDRITIDGCRIGYMYREEPSSEVPDSGWRFFAGDESEEYISDPEHSNVYNLNTICNYDKDIMPLLNAPYGTAYARDEKGSFVKEKLVVPE